MPLSKIIRIDPKDLEYNKAVGIALPFNSQGVFTSTYSTKDQIRANLINLLLTNKGEKINNPEFGADLSKLLFEPLTDSLIQKTKSQILKAINTFVPDVVVDTIDITSQEHSLYITASYHLKLSGTKDNITIELQ